MFRGSVRAGPGAVDRLAAELGGSVNAFTGHDSMVFYWVLPAGPWEAVLELEAERMVELTLSPKALALEKEIVRAEIAAAREDPWDRLEQAVFSRLWGKHPYGRSVLGNRSTVARWSRGSVEAFHRRELGPARAAVTVTGEVEGVVLEPLIRRLKSLRGARGKRRSLPSPQPPRRLVEFTLRHPDLPIRVLLALPFLSGRAKAEAGLEVLIAMLGLGRASRLHRRLVEEEGLATFVHVEREEGELASAILVASELVRGASPRDWKRLVFEELERLRRCPLEAMERERALAQLRAAHDTGLERAVDRALERTLGLLQRGHPWAAERLLARAEALSSDALQRIAQEWLHPERGGVLGVLRP